MKDLKEILILTSVFILILTGIVLGVWLLGCPTEVYRTIGRFESKDAGLRAAIPHLANEIQKCPDAELYRIVWSSPDSPEYQEVDRRALLYWRRSKAIGYEHDVFSGIPGKAYIEDEAAIREVAKKGGTLEDSLEYDEGRR